MAFLISWFVILPPLWDPDPLSLAWWGARETYPLPYSMKQRSGIKSNKSLHGSATRPTNTEISH